jgi:uncharacterized repeat protein (TIGR02543 family)
MTIKRSQYKITSMKGLFDLNRMKRTINIIICVIFFILWIPVSLPTMAVEDEGWLWPVPSKKTISSPMQAKRAYDGNDHNGIDIPGGTSDINSTRQVVAARSGVVKHVLQTDPKKEYGAYIILEHSGKNAVNGKTRYSIYAHMKPNSMVNKNGEKLKAKDIVEQGQPIGSTWHSGGLPANSKHLHFGIASTYRSGGYLSDFINVNPNENSMKDGPITLQNATRDKSIVATLFKGERIQYKFTVETKSTEPTKPYTVTFNPNGGSVSTTGKAVANGSTYGALPTPTRSGYVFSGWFTATSGGTQINSNSTVNLSGNQTLYAQWRIQSDSDNNRTNANVPLGKYLVKNRNSNTTTVPTWTEPRSTGTSRSTNWANGTIVTIVESQRNSAGNWWAKSASGRWIYSENLVAYRAPSENSSSVGSYVTTKSTKVYTDPSSHTREVRTLAANTPVTITATHVNAAGNTWGKIKAGEWVHLGNLKEETPPQYNYSTRLYCKGTDGELNLRDGPRNSKIIGAYKNGTEVWADVSKKDNDYVPVKIGNNVFGWMYYPYLSNTNPSPVSSTVTITYNANGGSGAPSGHTAARDIYGEVWFTLSSTKPTRDGYTFLGWRLENSTDYSIDSSGQSIVIGVASNSNVTLTYYAQWELIPTFNLPANFYRPTIGLSGGAAVQGLGSLTMVLYSGTNIPPASEIEEYGFIVSRNADYSDTYRHERFTTGNPYGHQHRIDNIPIGIYYIRSYVIVNSITYYSYGAMANIFSP